MIEVGVGAYHFSFPEPHQHNEEYELNIVKFFMGGLKLFKDTGIGESCVFTMI
jgi:hypothetical protein